MLHEEARMANARDEILPTALSQRIRSTMVCGGVHFSLSLGLVVDDGGAKF
jgi:hypothetical protein